MTAHALFVVTDPARRGAQVFGRDLCDSFGRAGRGVRMIALAPPPTRGTSPTLEIDTIGTRRLAPPTLRRLRREMRESSVAVGFGSTTLPAIALAGIGTSVPFVYRSIGELGFWARRADRKLRVKLALRRADAVVALWAGAKDSIVDEFGVPEDRVRVIPNAVSAEAFPVASAQARVDSRARFALPGDAPVIAIVGSLSHEKRVSLAIEAAALLPPDHILLIAGDGPDRHDLERRAQERAPNRVCFTGPLEDTSPVYAAADLIVLTSVSEGMPAVLIEAGLSGRAAVTTDAGAASEIVTSGVSGCVIPVDASPSAVADALRQVLQNAEDMGRAAHRICSERFELTQVSESWGLLLDEITCYAR